MSVPPLSNHAYFCRSLIFYPAVDSLGNVAARKSVSTFEKNKATMRATRLKIVSKVATKEIDDKAKHISTLRSVLGHRGGMIAFPSLSLSQNERASTYSEIYNGETFSEKNIPSLSSHSRSSRRLMNFQQRFRISIRLNYKLLIFQFHFHLFQLHFINPAISILPPHFIFIIKNAAPRHPHSLCVFTNQPRLNEFNDNVSTYTYIYIRAV